MGAPSQRRPTLSWVLPQDFLVKICSYFRQGWGKRLCFSSRTKVYLPGELTEPGPLLMGGRASGLLQPPLASCLREAEKKQRPRNASKGNSPEPQAHWSTEVYCSVIEHVPSPHPDHQITGQLSVIERAPRQIPFKKELLGKPKEKRRGGKNKETTRKWCVWHVQPQWTQPNMKPHSKCISTSAHLTQNTMSSFQQTNHKARWKARNP